MREVMRKAAVIAGWLLAGSALGAVPARPVPDGGDKDVAPASTWDKPATSLPSVISRPSITSPSSSREAMVYVQFLVSTEGIPTEVKVLQDRGFHTDIFRNAAMKYVRGMRFKPATRDGVPVVYGPLTQSIRFGLDLAREEQGVTPEFRRELDAVVKFMKDGDYAGAQFHAEWMLREKVKLGYEFAVLQAQLAQTLANVERYDEALAATWAATSRTSSDSAGFRIGDPPPPNDIEKYLLPKDLVVYLLELRMRLLAKQGDVLRALKTYNELAGLEELKADDPRTALANKLVEILQSNDALLFKGQVKANQEFWSHELFRPRFSTRNVSGKLSIVHLHCRGEFAQFEFEADKIWTLPSGWEGCIVELYGEPGATLEFVELPST